MKRYHLKDKGEIKAQQFRLGQDRGSWPPHIQTHRFKANRYEVLCNDSQPFAYQELEDGDWVTIGVSGWRHVMKPLEFEAKYEEAKD